MADQRTIKVPFKRGNTAQNDVYKGHSGEVTIDMQKRGLRVHDGIKMGGEEMLRRQDLVDVVAANDTINAAVAAAAGSATAAAGSATAAASSANSIAAAAATATAKAAAAAASEAAAAVSATSADGSKTAAAGSAAAADGSATAALASKTAAAGSAAAADTSKTAAAASAAAADTSKTAAAASAAAADTSKTATAASAAAALTSETNALASKNAAAASATAAATSAATAGTSATLAQDWATKTTSEVVAGQGFGAKKYAADALASSTAAGVSATAANTSAVAAAGSATTATTKAANAATSETNAAASAATATTKASDAAGSATAADGSKTAAAASAAAAATSATAADDSKTAAAASATTATTKATNAATSETNAAASASTATTKANEAADSAAAAAASAQQATTGQIQSNWTETDNTQKGYIQNKPVLAAVATSGLKADVGLANADNTADAAKPVSGPQQTALDLKLDKSNPTFTGTETGPSYVSTAFNGLRMKPTTGTGGIGTILRRDGGSFYVMMTNNGDADGAQNALRPITVTLATGDVSLGGGALAVAHGGRVTVTTQAPLDNSTTVATTAYADAAAAQVKADIVNGSSALLDTLSEFSNAIGNDANFAATNATALGNRLRVDVSTQGLTAGQKANAVTNLGLAAVATSGLKADVGLANVDNTSDINKPVSTAQAAADALKANIANPTFTGTVTGPNFAGNLTGYKNVDNTNEMTLANGFAGGQLNLNYRGATGAITQVNVWNGVAASGVLAKIVAFNIDASGNVTGNAATATKLATGRTINGTTFDGSTNITINAVDSTARAPVASPTFTGVATAPSYTSTGGSSYRLKTSTSANGIGSFWLNDGSALYLMLTANNDADGSYNALRPFYVSDTSGAVTMGNGAMVVNHNGPVNVATQTPGNNSTAVATTAYADAIAALKVSKVGDTITGTLTSDVTVAGGFNFNVRNTAGNGAQVYMLGNGATTPSKTVRVRAGSLEVVNDAQNAIIWGMADSGATTQTGPAQVNANGGPSSSNAAITTSGSFGGGYKMIDGTSTFMAWAQSGVWTWGFGSGASTMTARMWLDGSGVLSTTQFNGSGAGLTGTANSLTVYSANGLSGTALSQANTWEGRQTFKANKGNNSYSGNNLYYSGLMYSTDGGAAGMSFLREGLYGVNFGLDPDNFLRIGGWSTAASRFSFGLSAGDFYAAGNIVAYSDERLKTNWRDLSVTFLQEWARVKHGVYDRIDTGETQVGMSAQDVQKILPNAVCETADGYLTVNYGAAASVATIELAKEVLELRAQLRKQDALIKLLIEKVGM
jgi:hypothetical protein